MRISHQLIFIFALTAACKSMIASKKQVQHVKIDDLIENNRSTSEAPSSPDKAKISPASPIDTTPVLIPEPKLNDKNIPSNLPQATPKQETMSIRFVLPLPENSEAIPRPQITFTIADKTGAKAWNNETKTFFAELGQDLKIVNSDSVNHRLHTPNNKPCGSIPLIEAGKSVICRLEKIYDPSIDEPLYDDNFGMDAQFRIRVLPSVKKTLDERCIACHSGSRSEAGLDLLSWPPRNLSPSLINAFEQRLQLTAPTQKQMPPGGILSEAERTALLQWAVNGFSKPPQVLTVNEFNRSLRWMVIRDGQKIKEGMLDAVDNTISYPKDQTKVIIRLEESIKGKWLLLKEQEIRTTGNVEVSVPVRKAVAPLPVNIGIDDIVQFVKDSQIKNVEGLILALPEVFKRNYVLIRDTRSRHLSDASHPRLIMFSDSARLLLGFSSHPNDPLRENIEMQEAMDDGSWKFREIDFRASEVLYSQDDTACKICHGKRPRPIWGSYPNWPGALGDDGGRVSAEEFKAIEDLPGGASTKDRFASLSFSLRKDLNSFTLPKRYYNFSNTILNILLGRRVAYQLYRREIINPAAKKALFQQILVDECAAAADADASGLKWSAVVSTEDLALHRSSKDILTEDDRYWNESGVNLGELVLYFGLLDLINRNADLKAMFTPVLPQMNSYAMLMIGSEEQTLDLPKLQVRPSQYIYPRLLGDENGKSLSTEDGPSLSHKRSEFCKIVRAYFNSL